MVKWAVQIAQPFFLPKEAIASLKTSNFIISCEAKYEHQ
jgi:hypothetical protein